MRTYPVPPGMETELFVMEPGALADVPGVLAKAFAGRRPWIVADGNTYKAAGEKLQGLLPDAHPPHIFPGHPMLHPDSAYADALAAALPADGAPVAVGSGVINDLVKRAAGIAGVRYCCVPTAASVDGYTSFGAALSVEGFKKTLPCPAPLAVVADRDVMATAPAPMLAAGYADLLAKVPAGADWLIADALGEDPVVPAVWDLVQRDLRAGVADPFDLEAVFMGLAATGYAMQMHRESRPASGAEHLLSHIWEMEGLTCGGAEVSHGFKVGVGLLATARLMEFIIATPWEEARRFTRPGPTAAEREQAIARLLERGFYGDGAAGIAMAKFREGEALRGRREAIARAWEPLRGKLKEQLLPSADLAARLDRAGCPATPAAIGLGAEQYGHAIHAAQLIRKRYTILDLLYEAGLLDEAARRVVALSF